MQPMKRKSRTGGKLRNRSYIVYKGRIDILSEAVCALSDGQVLLAWVAEEGIVCLAVAQRGKQQFPIEICACYHTLFHSRTG